MLFVFSNGNDTRDQTFRIAIQNRDFYDVIRQNLSLVYKLESALFPCLLIDFKFWSPVNYQLLSIKNYIP